MVLAGTATWWAPRGASAEATSPGTEITVGPRSAMAVVTALPTDPLQLRGVDEPANVEGGSGKEGVRVELLQRLGVDQR